MQINKIFETIQLVLKLLTVPDIKRELTFIYELQTSLLSCKDTFYEDKDMSVLS